MSHILAISGGAIAGIVMGAVAVALLITFFSLVPLKPYFVALISGCYVSAFKLISLRFRKVDIMPILNGYVLSKKAGLGLTFNMLEAHQLAGGNVGAVISAIIKAKNSGIFLSFSQAASIDFSTNDILQAVESVITPTVSEIKDIEGTTRDNFELLVSAKITTKAKLESLVGGFGQETLESKVSKYILTKITTLNNHKNANAYNLTQDILKSGLDIENGYQLLSVDITSIKVVQDVGATLAAQDLERVRLQAQIESDRQKNFIDLQEQQQKVKTEEMKASVLEAEAEVPKAIAEAIRDGRFSVMDYYKLMNLQADTAMRRAMMGGGDQGDGQ